MILFAGAAGVWWASGGLDDRPPQPPPSAQIDARPPNPVSAGTASGKPGTSGPPEAVARSRAIDSPIRVNLTPGGTPRLRMAVDGPYRLLQLQPPGDPIRARRLTETDVRATADGIQIGHRADFNSIKGRATLLEIVPENSPAIWVNDRQYRGVVRLHRLEGGRLIAVNVLPLSEYLASVVDSEMPAAFPRAAREAQAIVSRTYALYQMATGHPQFDLYATTRSQNYLGSQYRDRSGRRLAGESDDSRSIVNATAGRVVTRDGKLIPAYYSAVCGGKTTPGVEVFRDAGSLAGVRCDGCREADLYRWQTSLDRDAASQALRNYLRKNGESFGTLASFAPSPTDGEPAAAHFDVSDGRRQRRLAAATLRREVFPSHLHSPRFSVRLTEKELLFEGRGSGHGVGLCQWGARGMALAGRNATQIVRHYYPGTRVSSLSSVRTAQSDEPGPTH